MHNTTTVIEDNSVNVVPLDTTTQVGNDCETVLHPFHALTTPGFALDRERRGHHPHRNWGVSQKKARLNKRRAGR